MVAPLSYVSPLLLYLGSAIRDNLSSFFSLDKSQPNGQVEWGEWRNNFVQEMGDLSKVEERRFKEAMAAAKAAWKEAARANPDKLNIDEFLSFKHPELRNV